jgi:hypothetical protein
MAAGDCDDRQTYGIGAMEANRNFTMVYDADGNHTN